MIVISNRVVSLEQAKIVSSLFTSDEAYENNMQLYVDGKLEICDSHFVELNSMVDLQVYIAPTYTQLCDRMMSRNLWLCDITHNEDFSEYYLRVGDFTYKTYTTKRDIFPADIVSANIAMYDIFVKYTLEQALPF